MDYVIRRCWTELIDNLIIFEVTPFLISGEILTSDEAELIRAKGSHSQQVEFLLMVLANRSNDYVWKSLVRALEASEQHHLVALLTHKEPTGEYERLMSQIHKKALRKCAHKFITEIDMNDDLVHFLASNVLRPLEKEIIQAKGSPPQQKEVLLDLLQRKPESAFSKFLEGLEHCQQFHLRDLLKEEVGKEEIRQQIDCVDTCDQKNEDSTTNCGQLQLQDQSTGCTTVEKKDSVVEMVQEEMEITVDSKTKESSPSKPFSGSLKRKRVATSTGQGKTKFDHVSPGSPCRGTTRLLRQLSFEEENKKIKTEDQPVDRDDTLTMYIHHISGVRKSVNQTSYFTMRVQTCNAEMNAICYDVRKYDIFKTALKSKQPVSLTDYSHDENKKIKINKDCTTKLAKSAAFVYTKKDYCYNSLSEVKSKSAGIFEEQTHIRIKVLWLGPVLETKSRFGKDFKKQEIHVGDESSSILLRAWDDYVGAMKQDHSYFVRNVRVKQENVSTGTYLTTTGHTEIEESVEHVQAATGDHINFSLSDKETISKIIGVKPNEYFKCPLCSCKLNPQPESLACTTPCNSKCKNTYVKPRKELNLRLTLEMPPNMVLTLFSSELDKFLRAVNPQLLQKYVTSPHVPKEMLHTLLLDCDELKITFREGKVVDMVPYCDS